jgi:hypothetical protein
MTISNKSIRGAAVLAAALLSAPIFGATNFVQTNLIADTAGAAAVVDPNLVGTWGISVSAGSPFWVSNAANGTSTVYTVSDATPATLTVPTIAAVVVTVPASANNTATKTGFPTGQVNNGYGVGNFETAPGAASSFIFASLDGTISARGGATAVIFVDNGAKGAVYGAGDWRQQRRSNAVCGKFFARDDRHLRSQLEADHHGRRISGSGSPRWILSVEYSAVWAKAVCHLQFIGRVGQLRLWRPGHRVDRRL